MDQDGRLLASVLRARAAHSGSRGLRPGWLLAVLLVLPIIGGAIAVRLVVARVAIQDPVAAEARGLGTVQPIPEHAEELSATPAPQLSAAAPTPTSTPAPIGPRRYVVQPGDTVLSIAERQGLHPATLASVNDLVDPDLLQPGQELLVPLTDGLVHVVKSGETLRSIGERYGVDIRAILSANDLPSPDRITVGLRLFVPDASPLSGAPG